MAKKTNDIPNHVYPCGKKFKVTVGSMPLNTYGETHGVDKTITLNGSPKKKRHLHSTLYHEYIHAILHCTGLSQMLSEELEEALVVAMEENTFHLIDPSKLSERP